MLLTRRNLLVVRLRLCKRPKGRVNCFYSLVVRDDLLIKFINLYLIIITKIIFNF